MVRTHTEVYRTDGSGRTEVFLTYEARAKGCTDILRQLPTDVYGLTLDGLIGRQSEVAAYEPIEKQAIGRVDTNATTDGRSDNDAAK